MNRHSQTNSSAEIGGRRMAYRDEGRGLPILMGHSYLWDSGMWSAQIAELSSDYRCVAPDLWAHGRSDTVEGHAYSIGDLAEDHLRLMDTLGIEKAGLVGLSVGGMWAAELAFSHPDRVAGLVLANTFVGSEPDESRRRYFGMLDMVEQAGQVPPALLDAILPLFFSPLALEDQLPSVARFRESLEGWPSDAIDGLVAVGRGIFSRPDRLADLAGLACPLLVIAGEHDASRPPEESAQMAEIAPDSRLKVLNSGHITAVEQESAVSLAIRSFFDEIDWL